VGTAKRSVSAAQPSTQRKGAVTKTDLEIVKRARQISITSEMNRADNRECPAGRDVSLYCALVTATLK